MKFASLSLSPALKKGLLPAKSLLSSLASRWRAFKTGSRDSEASLALEPLAFWPERPSTILSEPATAEAMTGYAFHTRYVRSTGGRIKFRIRLIGLTGTSGKLLVSINGINHSGQALTPKIEKFDVRDIMASGQEIVIERMAFFDFSYAVTGMAVDSNAHVDRIEVLVTGADDDEAYLARLQAAQRDFLAAPGEGGMAGVIVDRKATLSHPISQMCTAAQMHEPFYAEVCRLMGEEPKLHRKQWEFVYILRSLDYHGVLKPGARGLGFGVGVEPLSSIFANAGCEIVATDLPVQDDRASVWSNTAQLSAELTQVFHERLCDREAFFRNVTFRPVDMNAIPADLTGFDFTWSSCAYEHLGSIEAGLAFVENSLNCLVPGGLAIHTTELNLSSNDETLDKGNTVIFRRRDFEALAERLIARGHEVFPITFDSGDEELDRVIDLPPYSGDSHLKLALLRWVSTSFGLAVRKAA